MLKQYYVSTSEQLDELCDMIQGSAAIALDTEFMREKSYYANLCLLQIANENLIACVDPIALDTLEPLLDIVYDENVLKVMHSARQDLEILNDIRGVLPKPLFDTQIAATLLGYGDQVSYGTLVRDVLNVDLDKSHTRTNWSQRPLDSGQLRYAEDDVRYLLEISQRQMRKLHDMGRQGWLDEDFAELTNEENYNKPPSGAWQRIRGIRVLKGKHLAVLRALAAWREERARKLNKPRKWILRDDVLLDLSRRMPETTSKLRAMRGIEAQTVKKIGDEIVELIKNAMKLPEDEWPSLGFRFSPSAEQEALVDAMMAVVRYSGLRNGISPAALATRRDLEQLLGGESDHPILHGWRGMLVGRELIDFLESGIKLSVQNGVLNIEK
ncbi:MAG: ribonuclease D [Gammaproteobacteria bacterium]|nr:ribonuclease D [Gammaproteobacteria bacterium]